MEIDVLLPRIGKSSTRFYRFPAENRTSDYPEKSHIRQGLGAKGAGYAVVNLYLVIQVVTNFTVNPCYNRPFYTGFWL